MADNYEGFLQERAQRISKLREWAGTVLPSSEPITLELGCGHGHFLAAFSEAFSGEWCVGLDLRSRRIRLAEEKARKRGLVSLRFVKAEAGEFLDALEGMRRIQRVFMLFPDPWPKKRHHKNRMLQTALLTRLADLAVPGARLHFRTDHEENFAWAVEQVSRHSGWDFLVSEPWPHETGTYFQEVTGGRYKSFTARASR